MPAARQFTVLALDDVFCMRKCVVIACMVYVEMGRDEQIDIVRTQTQIGELLEHIFSLLRWRHPLWWLIIRRQSTVDQDVLPIARLHEIAPR